MKDNLPMIAKELREVNPRIYFYGVLVFFSTVPILAYRLMMIFNAEDTPISFSQALNITFVGYFFNNFLPSSVGGDIVKAMCATRITGHPVKSVTSVLMDRIFGLFTFIMIPSISYIFFHKSDHPYVPIVIYSFLFVSLACFILLFNRGIARKFRFVEHLLNSIKLGAKVRKVYDGLHVFKHRKILMFKAMALSVIGQGVGIYAVYILAQALGAKPSLVYFYLLIPVVNLIGMVPSLGGLGPREGAYALLLKDVIGAEQAIALSLLSLSVLFMFSVIGGIIYFVRSDYHFKFKEIKSPKTELL
jgi:uncharacterized protein (TIRG00374 family)